MTRSRGGERYVKGINKNKILKKDFFKKKKCIAAVLGGDPMVLASAKY